MCGAIRRLVQSAHDGLVPNSTMRGTHNAGRTERRLRIAIVGAGPSGMYATEALMDRLGLAVGVDLFDRVATPFGLVRYGVAPDHLTIRSVRTTFERVLGGEGVRFFGNMRVGHDLSVAELQRCYDAVIFTCGASEGRALGITGENLAGSIAATDLVAWYCGHPQAVRERIEAPAWREHGQRWSSASATWPSTSPGYSPRARQN